MPISSFNYPIRSYSWKLLSSNVAEKRLDKSAFFHNGSGLPKPIRSFFGCHLKMSPLEITFQYKGKKHQAVVIHKQSIDRFQLKWGASFAKVLANTFPNKKSGNGVIQLSKVSNTEFNITFSTADPKQETFQYESNAMSDSTSIRRCLQHIMQGLQNGVTEEDYTAHPLATFIRNDFKEELEVAINIEHPGLTIGASAGAGQWATVVWGAVFDPIITNSATKGYYLVYLFDAKGEKVFLSLNQGATAVYDEFKNKATTVLKERASFIRQRLGKSLSPKMVHTINLQSSQDLPKYYEAGHAVGYSYKFEELPTEELLLKDLFELCSLYKALTFRGGVSTPTDDEEKKSNNKKTKGKRLNEKRQYSLHKRIDRNPNLSSEVKKAKGYRCECCGMSFKEIYGDIGNEFIEAHHLVPISTLKEGLEITLDPIQDFAVLCSNCHRMIHKLDDPADLEGLRSILNANAS